MKKEILILGIIFIFIGVGIQPAFAVEISNDRTSDNVEDCDCQVDDNYRLEKYKNQIIKLKTYSKLLLTLSKNNPEVEVEYEKLLNDIDLFQEICDDLENNLLVDGRPICKKLKDLRWESFDKFIYYAYLSIPDGDLILSFIYLNISLFNLFMYFFSDYAYSFLLCNFFPLN